MGRVRRHPQLRQQLGHGLVAPLAAPHERPHPLGRSTGERSKACAGPIRSDREGWETPRRKKNANRWQGYREMSIERAAIPH